MFSRDFHSHIGMEWNGTVDAMDIVVSLGRQKSVGERSVTVSRSLEVCRPPDAPLAASTKLHVLDAA